MARILGRKIDLDAVRQQSEWELAEDEDGGSISNTMSSEFREGIEYA